MTIDARFYLQKEGFVLDVEMSIPSRGVTAIFGPSGCGKTTLLRAIAGLEKSRENNPQNYLRVGDQVWQNTEKSIPAHQRAIGFVFQEASLFEHLNVEGNLQYGLKRMPVAERRVALDQVVELLGIGHLRQRKVDQLSGGERQRVAIARALAVSPRVLLMDEPLSALDVQRKREIIPYLEQLHDELDIPIIYVSHAPDEVARLADHLVVMDVGKVTASGPIGEMLTRLDSPLAQGDEAEAIIEATVAEQDTEFGLTYFDFGEKQQFDVGGGWASEVVAEGAFEGKRPSRRFAVAHRELPIGHKARLRILARDVSITLQHQSNTSILNIFPATVEALNTEIKGQVIVRLLVGGLPILSRITRKSAVLLELEAGKQVYAQIKGVALLP